MRSPLPFNELIPILEASRTAILLDTAGGHDPEAQSFLFLDPREELRAGDFDSSEDFFFELQSRAEEYWVVGLVQYGFAYRLDVGFEHDSQDPDARGAWFGVFDQPFVFQHSTAEWDRTLPEVGVARRSVPETKPVTLTPAWSADFHEQKVRKVKEWIALGETYQVNLTLPFEVLREGSSLDWYRRLRLRQRAPFSAYLKGADGEVLSLSPELFFKREEDRIFTRPMKGTIRRGRYSEEDERLRKTLQASRKERAENLMIVDLFRNDLGRICEIGSVEVRDLFSVERYPTVYQMTSEIRGRLRPDTSYLEIFRSLFPSGSVTGAPKRRTVEIIRQLETQERGLYCGALGYFAPGGRAQFSIPIRTLTRRSNETRWRLGVGSGIVWDSDPGAEWREVLAKSEFAREDTLFSLVETILWTDRLIAVEEHWQRLLHSAAFFEYPLNRRALVELEEEITSSLQPGRKMVRVLLDAEGSLRWKKVSLARESLNRNEVYLSRDPVDEMERLLFHKTTYRPWYAEAARMIGAGKCFDLLFLNSQGELTEGSRSNVFLEIGESLYTPPVRCGLLPGVLRGHLLEQEQCREKVLRREDLIRARRIFCGNSVRGLVPVQWSGELSSESLSLEDPSIRK